MAPLTLDTLREQKVVTYDSVNDIYTLNKSYPLAAIDTLIIDPNQTLMIQRSTSLTNNGTITNKGVITNEGTIDSSIGLLNNSGTITNNSVSLIIISANNFKKSIVINNYILSENYTLQKGWELKIAEDQTLDIAPEDGRTLTNNGSIINNGTIINYSQIVNKGKLTNNKTITNNVTILNDKGGTIQNNDTITNNISYFQFNGIVNEGEIDTSAGTITNIDTIQNKGTIKIGLNGLTDAITTNQKTYTLSKSYTLNKGFQLNLPSTHILIITYQCTLTIIGTITNSGLIIINEGGGTLINQGTIENKKLIENYSSITNTGIIINGPPAEALIFNHHTIINSGKICGGNYKGSKPTGNKYNKSCDSTDSLGDTELEKKKTRYFFNNTTGCMYVRYC